MAYISSNDNRFYVALEQTYGAAAAIASKNRIPALKLTVKQRPERIQRKDKTGSRTFPGLPSRLRKTTDFELKTYMTGWTDQTTEPAHGPAFQACLGAAGLAWGGGVVASSADPFRVAFTGPHGLAPGQAISAGGEIRFVSAIVDDHTVQLNAPFDTAPAAGTQAGPTTTYAPGSTLKSLTLMDSWSPGSSVQRLLCGAALNEMKLQVNGDFHEFTFSGSACDVLDSASFEAGQSGLTSFPPEPAIGDFNYSIVPGHLGQIWIGSIPEQFFTVTKADLTFNNDLELRAKEFGSNLPRAIAPGRRSVTLDFDLYQQDNAATQAIYQAARQRSPIAIMIQLGQQPGELLGVYMKSVIPETPEFDDAERRQQWQFRNCRAQGNVNDEIFIAFG